MQAYREVGAAGVNFFSYDGMTRGGRAEAYLAKVSRALFGERVASPDWKKPRATASGNSSNGSSPGRG